MEVAVKVQMKEIETNPLPSPDQNGESAPAPDQPGRCPACHTRLQGGFGPDTMQHVSSLPRESLGIIISISISIS